CLHPSTISTSNHSLQSGGISFDRPTKFRTMPVTSAPFHPTAPISESAYSVLFMRSPSSPKRCKSSVRTQNQASSPECRLGASLTTENILRPDSSNSMIQLPPVGNTPVTDTRALNAPSGIFSSVLDT